MRLAILSIALILACGLATEAAAAPRTVELGIFMVDISALDEIAETYTAEFDVIARWRDPARAFTPIEGEELPRLLIGADTDTYLATGWDPELRALNAIDDGPARMRALLQPDGTITLRAHIRRTLRAQLDFRHFPFDHQVLPLHVESLLHDSDEMTLEVERAFTGFDSSSFEMPEWRVNKLTTTKMAHERVQEKQTYDRLSFLINIERREGYYVWKIMLPMVVIVMLSWVVFWMSDEQLGRRAGISSTGMLTVIAYQFVVAGSLPRFHYQTIMDRFVLVSLLAIAATMAINLIGSRLDIERRVRLDRTCRVVFPAFYVLAVVFALTRSMSTA